MSAEIKAAAQHPVPKRDLVDFARVRIEGKNGTASVHFSLMSSNLAITTADGSKLASPRARIRSKLIEESKFPTLHRHVLYSSSCSSPGPCTLTLTFHAGPNGVALGAGAGASTSGGFIFGVSSSSG